MATKRSTPAKPKATAKAKAKVAAKPRAKTAVAPKPKATAKPKTAVKTKAPATHPKLALLLEKLPTGRYAGGAVILTAVDAHADELGEWLGGNVAGRTAIGRTAFGDLILFRDRRAIARELAVPDAENACDVAIIDLNRKSMNIVALSVEAFVTSLADKGFRKSTLRGALYDKAKSRVGDYADDEAFAFVPALRLGGSEKAESVQRAKWNEYQSILFQL